MNLERSRLMLVLSRYKSESIVIKSTSGETVTIMVTDVFGKRVNADGTFRRPQVKIGIDAPHEWTINREEIQKAIDKEASSG